MDNVEKELRTQYGIEQAKHQIAVYKGRQTRMATPLQRYFNSSPARNTFARQMFIAAHVKSLYTKKAIAEELGISWQAAHTMVEECKASGWVEVDEARETGKGATFKASPTLVEAHNWYIDFHIQTVNETGTRYYINALDEYRRGKRQAGLDCESITPSLDYSPDTDKQKGKHVNTNVRFLRTADR
ncbi:MAG: hypothetical protein CMP82_14965 [Gammaproteobacteria bacterium]|nr:hypothetical protein [Gammaproteobacteria bacterium]|tara:strand:- start:13004 stop:13561 length:558 start_codon:yes stop_codon:yes gene_type:complete